MSSSGDGDKAAQSGLVDMGDIGFYSSNTPDLLITFTIADLAKYPGSFSEIVLNVTWAQLQSAAGGSLDTAFIDNAISAINAYNAANGTNLGIKLRVWGGYTAPDWAKNIDGPPITVTGEAEVDPAVYTPQTIGRFWTADYIDAWTSLQRDASGCGFPLRRPPLRGRHHELVLPRWRRRLIPSPRWRPPPGKLRVAASTSCPPADSRLRSAAGRPPCPAPWR